MSRVTPQELVERVLSLSQTDNCVVIVRQRSEANLRWARNTLTTNGEISDTSVTVIAIVGVGAAAAAGSITRSGVSLDMLPDLLVAARIAAEQSGPADDAADLLSGIAASTDWANPSVGTSGSVFAHLAPALGEVFGAGSADGIEHFGYAEHSVSTTFLGTSTGIRLRHVQPEGRLELTAKSHARTRSAWAGAADRTFTTIDLPAMDAELRQGLAWQERQVQIPAGRRDAVLSPSAVSDLLIDLYWNAIGRDASEGRSVFSRADGTKLGELIAKAGVNLWSDPAAPGLQSSPFEVASASSSASSIFDNGLPLERTDWIRDGVLESLITTRSTARETGLAVRPAVDNLVLDVAGSTGTLADLVSRTDNGLLVTCLWYSRVVDPQTLLLTGLTRDGVYVVANGEVVGATTNFRFNDSPVAILQRIVDAGATAPTLAREMGDYFNRAAMPPLRVSDFNFSTVSQAL
jgi:predicted Zn-dependent protease